MNIFSPVNKKMEVNLNKDKALNIKEKRKNLTKIFKKWDTVNNS